jgi:DNA-directed RNA polymerase specialized sigma24 family protein
MTGAHGAWRMAAEMHRPTDIPAVVRQLAAQGLKQFDIAERLGVGVGAVEEALREAETMPRVPA